MAVISELLIARHGEAHCNVAGLVGGERTCTGLTEHGRRQVTALGQRLAAEQRAGHTIDRLYTGPRLRLRQSGQLLGDALGLPLRVEARLDGPHHGHADGSPWHEVKSAFGGPPAARPDQPWAAGSETWSAYLARTTALLSELLHRHPHRRILIAGHGETVEAANLLLLGLAPEACARVGFVTGHASLTRWQQHRNRFGRIVWMLAAHNDTAHLNEPRP